MYRIKTYGPADSDKVLFLFSGLSLSAWQLNGPGLPLWTFRRAGWQIIFYEYPWKIAHSVDTYLETLEAVYTDAEKRLQSIPVDKKIAVIGISFGSLPAVRLAASFKRVEALILNVPYADPVINLKDFPPEKIRSFLGTTHTEQSFGSAIRYYAPLRRAKDLGHVKVMLFIAHKDHYFHPSHARKLRDELGRYAKQFTCYESKSLGHKAGATKYNIQSAKWLKWLDQQKIVE